jgi:sRNA-binding protein
LQGIDVLTSGGNDVPAQGAAGTATAAAETPEEKEARKEAKKKAKAEEKARKEAEKVARAAQRGQKAAVLTAPDPSDPHGSHYGDAAMVQSRAVTTTQWTRVADLDTRKVGQSVRS